MTDEKEKLLFELRAAREAKIFYGFRIKQIEKVLGIRQKTNGKRK